MEVPWSLDLGQDHGARGGGAPASSPLFSSLIFSSVPHFLKQLLLNMPQGPDLYQDLVVCWGGRLLPSCSQVNANSQMTWFAGVNDSRKLLCSVAGIQGDPFRAEGSSYFLLCVL